MQGDPLQPWYALLRRRLRVLRWAGPISLFVLVVAYQFGPALWLERNFGPSARQIGAVLFYGTVGPILLWLLLEMLDRWLHERETSELQSSLLMQAREAARARDESSDTALQKLFAANLLIQSLTKDSDLNNAPVTDNLLIAHQALEDALRDLAAGPSFPPD
jgi:hypothetical protein